LKILFISSEAAPLAKVGGLADVVGSLPRALRRLGHDVRAIMPQYDGLEERYQLSAVIKDYSLDFEGEYASINLTNVKGVPFYLLDNRHYFGNREVYSHDLERFYFFSRAIFELLPLLDWQPEIVHCHDWLTALIVSWQKNAGQPYKHVFSIHNLAYQGFFDDRFKYYSTLKDEWQNVPQGAPAPPFTFMSQAILWADLVTTVSQTYAREITTPEYGEGLDKLLRFRQDSLEGIINGLDTEDWNPQTDPLLPLNYSADNLNNRRFNKAALQRVAGLPVQDDIPLIGMVQRLDEQKGLDILGQGLDRLLKETSAQLVITGKGRENYENLLREITIRYPQRVSGMVAFEEPLARLVYAGCDIFLMPSRFEPCGLGQLIAMRYGAIPVVRHTGGLVDTVPGFDADLSRGNGFIFHDYTAEALVEAAVRATTAYENKARWQEVARRLMRLDFSWNSSALEYEKAYQKVLNRNHR
jgi:starch synthase